MILWNIFVGYELYSACNCCSILLKCPLFSFFIGLREWFAQTDERNAPSRIPVMVNMSSTSVSAKKSQKPLDSSVPSLDQMNAASRNSVLMDEYSEEEEDYQMAEPEHGVILLFPIPPL